MVLGLDSEEFLLNVRLYYIILRYCIGKTSVHIYTHYTTTLLPVLKMSRTGERKREA